MMPGRTLHRLATRICTRKTLEQIVEPAIADLQKDYSRVIAGQSFLRVGILLRGYWSLLKVLVMCALSIHRDIEGERNVLAQTLGWSLGCVVASAALLILPPLYHWGDALSGWYVAMTLVPQAVPLAIPIGIVFGFAIAAPGRSASRMPGLLSLATAASLLSFVALGWGMPAGNQAFREIAFRTVIAPGYDGPVTLQKGHNEMSFSELRREISALSAAGQPRAAQQFSFAFHLRFALAPAAVVLAGALLAAGGTGRALRVLFAVAACVTYWVLLHAGEGAALRGHLPAPIGAWLPNLGVVAFTILIVASRSSRLPDRFSPAK